MVHGKSCLILALFALIMIFSAGCMSADLPANAQTTARTEALASIPETAELLSQMDELFIEGTNGVLVYIISGDTVEKLTFLQSMDQMEILDAEMRAVIDTRPEPVRQHLLDEYGMLDEARRNMADSAIPVIEEYEARGSVSESTLGRFSDDAIRLASAFETLSSPASVPGQRGTNTYTREYTIVSLMTMQEEMMGSIGESPGYIPPAQTG